MTIDEEAFSKAVMAAAPLGFVSTTQMRKAIEAYEQAKKPVMGEVCPSGSRIGSTEAEVQSHAGSNPATSPANTALVQKLMELPAYKHLKEQVDDMSYRQLDHDGVEVGVSRQALHELMEVLTEAQAYLKQQEGKASEGVENALEIYEFAYEKYGEHVVALRNSPQGGGVQLFNTVKLFAENNSLKEYERVKDEAATFAKKFVAQFNAPTQQPAQQGKRAEGVGAVEELKPNPYVNGWVDNNGVSFILKKYNCYSDFVLFEDGKPTRCFRFTTTSQQEGGV